jgi:hypothetical protein
MSYFKIYPQKITMQPGSLHCHPARLFYNFEQYGYLYRDKNCAVAICADVKTNSHWKMTVTETDTQVKKFHDFITALNFYLFQVLKFHPLGASNHSPQEDPAYYFEPVYFDILDGRIKKITGTEKKLIS